MTTKAVPNSRTPKAAAISSSLGAITFSLPGQYQSPILLIGDLKRIFKLNQRRRRGEESPAVANSFFILSGGAYEISERNSDRDYCGSAGVISGGLQAVAGRRQPWRNGFDRRRKSSAKQHGHRRAKRHATATCSKRQSVC